MGRFIPFVSVETFDPVASLPNHLTQLMEAYGFDSTDIAENRAGKVTARQTEAMKGFQRGKIGVLLLIIIVLVALPLLAQFFSFIPRESIVVTVIGVPVLGLWLLITLIRRAFPGQGKVMSVEGHFQLDSDATLRTGGTTYNYLQQVTGSGMIKRYRRVALLRRSVFQFNPLHPEVVYRVYYFENRNLSYVLSIEPIAQQDAA